MEQHEGLAAAAELCVTVKSPANNEHALRLFPQDTVLDLQGEPYYIVRDEDGIFLICKDQFTPSPSETTQTVSTQRSKDRIRALRILEIAENTVACIMAMQEDTGEGSSTPGPEVQAEMEELRKRLESALAQVSELEGVQAEKERLNDLIGQRESELEQQRERLQSLEQERDRLALENQSIEGLNAQIREQGERIVEQGEALETLREQAIEQASRIQDLETQLQQRSAELERTRTELEQLKSEIDPLRNRVSRLEEALRSDDPLIREFLLLEQQLEALELATSEMGPESAIPTMGKADMETLRRGAVASKETEAKITSPNKGKTGKVEPQRVLEIGGPELRVPLGNLCESRQAFYFEHGDKTCFIAFLGTTNSHRIVTLKPGGSGISNAVADQVQLLQEVSDPNQRKIICIVIALQTGMNFSQALKALTPASVAEAAPPPSDEEDEEQREEQTSAEAAYQRIEEEGEELICIPYSSVTGFRNSELEDLSFHFGAAKKNRAAVERAIERIGVSRYLKTHPYAYLNLSEEIGFYLIFTQDHMVAIKTTELGAEHPAMIEENMTAIPDGPIRNFLLFRGVSALKNHIDPPAKPEPETAKSSLSVQEIEAWEETETLTADELKERLKSKFNAPIPVQVSQLLTKVIDVRVGGQKRKTPIFPINSYYRIGNTGIVLIKAEKNKFLLASHLSEEQLSALESNSSLTAIPTKITAFKEGDKNPPSPKTAQLSPVQKKWNADMARIGQHLAAGDFFESDIIIPAQSVIDSHADENVIILNHSEAAKKIGAKIPETTGVLSASVLGMFSDPLVYYSYYETTDGDIMVVTPKDLLIYKSPSDTVREALTSSLHPLMSIFDSEEMTSDKVAQCVCKNIVKAGSIDVN